MTSDRSMIDPNSGNVQTITLNTPPPIYASTISAQYDPLLSQPLIGEFPTRLKCPNCTAEVLTKINYKSGCLTWALSGALCGIGCLLPFLWLGCQFIPFCVNAVKDVIHDCPNCGAHIGRFDRMK